MSSGRRRRTRRQRKIRAQARARGTGRVAGPDAVAQQLLDGMDRYARYVQTSAGPDEAVAKIREDVRAACRAIVEAAQGRGSIDVIQGAWASMSLQEAVTGGEVAVAALELIALTLACRGTVPQPPPVPNSNTPYLPSEVYAAAKRALDAGSMLPIFEVDRADPFAEITYATAQREIAVRNVVYPHMLLGTLRGLFDHPQVSADCHEVLGFTGLQAVNVMEAVRMLAIRRLSVRFDRMIAARDASIPILAERREDPGRHSSSHTDSTAGQFDDLDPEVVSAMTEVFEALQDLTTNVGESAVIDVEAVAQESDVPPDRVRAVLDRFTLRGVIDLDETTGRFFRGDNPLRTAPLVADADGRRMLVHEALALPAVREVIEAALKRAGRLSAYERHRGRWVEQLALDLLADVLPGAAIHRGFNYFVPDPTSATPQTRPDRYTKRVEADGLILIDDVAIVIEVKAVALTAEARGGAVGRLKGKLRDIITNAASQADRLHERIVDDRMLRLDNGQTLDLSGVREIHSIAVGLEDLSGVSTATAKLVDAGVLKPGHIPWTVSLHDLQIICELLDRPSELLLYLRRRTHAGATRKFLAVDELDLYMHFLRHGLYVEPNPERVAEDLPWAGRPTQAALRRHANQGRELITSLTEPLEAWYQSQLDPSAPTAHKPSMQGKPEFFKLVDDVTATAAPGWLSTATILLEGSSAARREFSRYARDLARLVKNDGQHHSATQLLVDTGGNSFVLVWVCCGRGQTVEQMMQLLDSYLAAKKHQIKASRAALMLFDSAGKELLRLQFDNRRLGPAPELDEAAARLEPPSARRKVPTRSSHSTRSHARKRSRRR